MDITEGVKENNEAAQTEKMIHERKDIMIYEKKLGFKCRKMFLLFYFDISYN